MIRLIGILTGSAIAVAFLIITLGIPEFAGPGPAAVEMHETPTVAHAEPAAPISVPPATVPESPVPVAESPEPVTEAATPVTEPPALVAEYTAAIEETPDPIEQHWYAFWSPFRSKIAADGFVSQLQRATGLDYRVVKLKPGVYEVAFAYADASDIEHKLAQISSATGLDLTGG